MKKGKKKYAKDLPRQLYAAFISMVNDSAVPSFSKFARSIGVTTADLEAFRSHSEFDRAWRECIEIKRDYLTECALTRRYDPSFVKFLLAEEFGVGYTGDGEDKNISVSVKVID